MEPLNEAYKVGDHVVPKIGPHAGQVHRVIHVHDTGHLNITPVRPGKNRYHLGAAKASPTDLEKPAPGEFQSAQTMSESSWMIIDHEGKRWEVLAKDRTDAMKQAVSVGGTIHPKGVPMTQWHKVRIEKKNLEEKVLTPAETDKKEEMVKSMKKGIQGFKERYGKDAKSVMYATATKQAKHLAEGIEPLDESFMSTYNRNENANEHTANIVHLAKHFGDAADQSQAKFYAQELKKHGHNIHHEAQYKLHEKLFPKALAAHHMKEATEGLKPLTQYTYVPNRGHFVGGKKGDRAFLKHQAEYTKRKKITPVKEDVEQLSELKMPKVPFGQKILGVNLRDVVSRVHDMGHHELKSLHKSYEKNAPQSVVQAQQHRSIKKAQLEGCLLEEGTKFKNPTPKAKKKFVPNPKVWKKMPVLGKLLGVKLKEAKHTLYKLHGVSHHKVEKLEEGRSHDELVKAEIRANRPIKRVLRENYMMQDRRFQGGYEIPHSTHTEYHAWGQVTHHSDAEAKADRDAKAKEWKQQGHKVTKHRSTNAIYDPDGPFTTSGTVYSARKHHAHSSHVKEEAALKPLSEEVLKSSHGTADGHSHAVRSSFSKGKFHGTVHTSHRDNRYTYTGPEARSPVEHEKPKHWEHDVRHGTTSSAIRKKNPHLDHTQSEAISRHFEEHKNRVRQLSEEVEQIDELSKKTLSNYVQQSAPDLTFHSKMSHINYQEKEKTKSPLAKEYYGKEQTKHIRKEINRETGIVRAAKRLGEEREVEQIDELKMPSRWANIKHALGSDDRSVKASAHRINHETKNMSDKELHSLHKSYGQTDKINPEKTAHGSNQHMQQRAIHREVKRRASTPQEPLQEHSSAFETVKTVIHEALRKGVNLRSQSDIDKFAKRGRAAKNLFNLGKRELTKLSTKIAKEPKD